MDIMVGIIAGLIIILLIIGTIKFLKWLTAPSYIIKTQKGYLITTKKKQKPTKR